MNPWDDPNVIRVAFAKPPEKEVDVATLRAWAKVGFITRDELLEELRRRTPLRVLASERLR